MKEFNLLINGRFTPGALTMDVINPATGKVLAISPRADAKQLDTAVQAAKAAFPAWSRLSVATRRAKIMAIADGVEARLDELARLSLPSRASRCARRWERLGAPQRS